MKNFETSPHLPLIQHHLVNWKASKQIPSALLLSFPKGSQEKEATRYLVQWMLCLKNPGLSPVDENQDSLFGGLIESDTTVNDGPCGTCTNCLSTENAQNVDVTEIQAVSEDAAKSTSLKIEDLEPIKKALGFSPHQSRFRVFILREIESLTPTAANSLLKILEEPPAQWKFLLTTSDASLIMPTIVSRCQRIRFKPLTSTHIESVLHSEDVGLDRRQLAAKLAQGNLDRAHFLIDDEIWKKRSLIGQFLLKPETVLNDLVEWAAKDHQAFQALIDQWEYVLCDLSLLLSGASTQFENTDLATSLKLWMERATKQGFRSHELLSRTQTSLDQLASVRQRMLAPLNRKLLAQEVLIPWLSVLS